MVDFSKKKNEENSQEKVKQEPWDVQPKNVLAQPALITRGGIVTNFYKSEKSGKTYVTLQFLGGSDNLEFVAGGTLENGQQIVYTASGDNVMVKDRFNNDCFAFQPRTLLKFQ